MQNALISLAILLPAESEIKSRLENIIYRRIPNEKYLTTFDTADLIAITKSYKSRKEYLQAITIYQQLRKAGLFRIHFDSCPFTQLYFKSDGLANMEIKSNDYIIDKCEGTLKKYENFKQLKENRVPRLKRIKRNVAVLKYWVEMNDKIIELFRKYVVKGLSSEEMREMVFAQAVYKVSLVELLI